MKKLALVLFLAILLPQIALAAWWNPLSWFGFSIVKTPKTENQSLKKTLLASTSTSVNSAKIETTRVPTSVKATPKSVSKSTTQISTIFTKTQVVEPTSTVSEVSEVYIPNLKIVGEPYITQTIFNGYGGYEIRLRVVAEGDDFYIPMTTTDSTRGMTGFSYSIKGGEFKGGQTSKVLCTSYKDNLLFSGGVNMGSQCFIPRGTSLDITATVWLVNKDPGNYSVLFNKLGYFREGDRKMLYHSLNIETEYLYLK